MDSLLLYHLLQSLMLHPEHLKLMLQDLQKGWYLLNMCLRGMYSNVYNQLHSHTVLQQCCSMQSHRLQALNNHQSFQVHKIYLQHKNEQFFLNSCLVSFYQELHMLRIRAEPKGSYFCAFKSYSLTKLFLLYMLNCIHSKKFVVLRMVSW